MNIHTLTQVIDTMQIYPSKNDGSNKANGMATYSKLYSFAKDCVMNYATFDKFDQSHSLYVKDLPDFVRHEFASLLIRNDDSLASEASGPDNEHWETRMLPSLIRYLKDTTDKDNEIEFINTWRDCIANYSEFKMQEFIDEALSNYNARDRYDD